MTGATITPAGTPAALSRATASSRRSAVDVRGSSARRSVSSSVVIDSATLAQLIRGELGEDVGVARDQRVLGDDADRVAELGQHLEAAPRQLQRPLDRLVAVGDAAEGHHLRLPRRRRQRRPEQLRRVLLDEDPRLEVEAGREAEELVRRPRIAVDAAVLAAAVRVEAGREGDVRAVVGRDDRCASGRGSTRCAPSGRARRRRPPRPRRPARSPRAGDRSGWPAAPPCRAPADPRPDASPRLMTPS